MRDDFVVFIISHERSARVETYKMLRDAGYTGKIKVVVDYEDEELSEYKERFIGSSDDIVIYDRNTMRATTYVCRVVEGCATYARNAVEEYVANAGDIKAFMVADDDLLRLRYRYDDKGVLRSTAVKNHLDDIIEEYVDFILSANIACVSFGTANIFMKGIKPEAVSNNRIPFNCFIRNAEYKWEWKAEIYEDAVTAMLESWNGDFAMQLPFVQCDMSPMDAGAKGGMTDVYTSISQYEKNFPVLIYAPSCVKLGFGKRNFIYMVKNKNAFPKLVSSKYKKQAVEK